MVYSIQVMFFFDTDSLGVFKRKLIFVTEKSRMGVRHQFLYIVLISTFDIVFVCHQSVSKYWVRSTDPVSPDPKHWRVRVGNDD